MGRAWLWTGSFGILFDFPVVALEIGFLPGREEVESQPSLSSPLLQAFMKASLVFRVGKEGVVLCGKRLQGQGSTPGSSGSQEKENPPLVSSKVWGQYLAESEAYSSGTRV